MLCMRFNIACIGLRVTACTVQKDKGGTITCLKYTSLYSSRIDKILTKGNSL